MKTDYEWTRIDPKTDGPPSTTSGAKILLGSRAPGATMSWHDGFPGARASRPHQACHSPARISHRIAGCSMKGIYFQYLIGFLMRACKYRRRWARSGLSFSPRSAHARSTVETATLFAREHALREKFLRHPALFSRVQPPGEKCGLVALRSPSCPFVDFFFLAFVDNPQLFQTSPASALPGGSYESETGVFQASPPLRSDVLLGRAALPGAALRG